MAAIVPTILEKYALGIDHLAIAVPDLETSVTWFTSSMGFKVKERRETTGTSSGMISAVLEIGALNFVLLQGTTPESQVTKFVEKYGPGVQHIAVRVEKIHNIVEELTKAGVPFSTNLIEGGGLRQIFTQRDEGSGVMMEFIERDASGFADQNVASLFSQLEKSGSF